MDQLSSQSSLAKRRRRHSVEFKKRLVEASNDPNQSVASVALEHGVNANQLHRWRRELKPSEPSDFVRLPVPAAINHYNTLRIELPGGIVVYWPMDRLDESVVWLKALMR